MIVCSHGNVSEFCREHGMISVAEYVGALEEYDEKPRILVTDRDMSENEYYYLKGLLLARGVDLISTKHKDDEKILSVLTYNVQRQQEQHRIRYGGRQPFGYRKQNGVVVEIPEMMVVARRIIELRDGGMSLHDIRDVAGIRHPDGRKISVSTIQQIVKNREKYEKKV